MYEITIYAYLNKHLSENLSDFNLKTIENNGDG